MLGLRATASTPRGACTQPGKVVLLALNTPGMERREHKAGHFFQARRWPRRMSREQQPTSLIVLG